MLLKDCQMRRRNEVKSIMPYPYHQAITHLSTNLSQNLENLHEFRNDSEHLNQDHAVLLPSKCLSNLARHDRRQMPLYHLENQNLHVFTLSQHEKASPNTPQTAMTTMTFLLRANASSISLLANFPLCE